MNTTAFEMTEARTGPTCVLVLTGRIDSTNAELLKERIRKLFAAGEKHLVVDFKDVAYLTSAAFRVLLVATDEAERHAARFELCSVQGQVREIFAIAGLVDTFTIHASRDEALAGKG